jgi:DNA polymerase-4/DNA polymerase V
LADTKEDYQTISKFKTFFPSSSDPERLFAELLSNLESACSKARRHGLAAQRLFVSLRNTDFSHIGKEAKLSRPTAATLDLVPVARTLFSQLLSDQPENAFRQTGVVLGGLRKAGPLQFGIFEPALRILRIENASVAMDEINDHYGPTAIHLAEDLLRPASISGDETTSPLRMPAFATKA